MCGSKGRVEANLPLNRKVPPLPTIFLTLIVRHCDNRTSFIIERIERHPAGVVFFILAVEIVVMKFVCLFCRYIYWLNGLKSLQVEAF